MSCGAARYPAVALVGGLTLVELLVSLTLGVLLSAGMVSAYLDAKRNLFYEDQMARMQENGRYAMRLLARELAMTGFYGGLPLGTRALPVPVSADCSAENWALDSSQPMDLVNDYAGQSPPMSVHLVTLSCLDHSAIALETDLLALKRTAADASLDHGVPAANLSASTVERWYLRADSGNRPEWVKLRSTDLYDPGNTLPSLSYWEAVSKVFFIRAYANDKDDGIPSLCMETLAGAAMTSRCLVEGVENLQLEFGIDADDDGVPNQYTAAPAATEMQRAVAVRIHLLLRSISKLTGHHDDKSYHLGQKVLAARGDAYLRRVLSATVLLRNHAAVGG